MTSFSILKIMAKPMADVDSELLCAICHEELNDPRFLPCHHYFCAACIQNVADTAGAVQNNSSFQKMAQILRKKSFPCPECRKNTVLPGNNARSLPQAFVVNRMKESLKKLRAKPAPLNPANAQSCSLHDIALKLLCLDCQQMICPECVLSTHKYHKYEYPDQIPSDYMTPVNQKHEEVHPEASPTINGDSTSPPRRIGHQSNIVDRDCIITDTRGNDTELQVEEADVDVRSHRNSTYRHKKKSTGSSSLPSSARYGYKLESSIPPVPPPRKPSAGTFERHYLDTEAEGHRTNADAAAVTYMTDHSWYHFNTDRITAESMLNAHKKDGMFLIRDSSKTPGEYTLSIWYQGIKHMRIIVDEDGYFSLHKSKRFRTPVDLVLFYKHETLLFKCGGGTILKYECPK